MFSMATWQAGSNQSAIDNAYAALALAQNKLNPEARTNYQKMANAPLTDPIAAQGYRDLYTAQQAYNTALTNYNAISSKSSRTDAGFGPGDRGAGSLRR